MQPSNQQALEAALSSLGESVRRGSLRGLTRALVQARSSGVPAPPLLLHALTLDAELGGSSSWVLPLAGVVLERLGEGEEEEERLLATLFEGCVHLHRRARGRKRIPTRPPPSEEILLQLCADPSRVAHLGSVAAAFEVLGASGASPEQRALVLHALQRSIERTPQQSGHWRERLDTLDTERLERAAITGAPAWFDRGALLHQLLDAPPEACLDAWIQALSSGVPLPDLAELLLLAASRRLLRFDIAHEFDPRQPLAWTALSRSLELSVALAERLQQPCGPVAVPLLLAAVWRISHLGSLDGEHPGLREPEPGGIEALQRAAFTRNPDRAVALARALPPGRLAAFLLVESLEERLALPQSRALNLLAVSAALSGSRLLDPDEARLPLLAVTRLLCSPRMESGLGRALAAARE